MPGGYMDTHLEDAICLGNQRKDEVEQTRRYKYLRSPMAQQWKEEFVGVFEVHPPDTTPETKDHSKWMTFTEPFDARSGREVVARQWKTIHKATSVKKSDFSLQTMTSERQKLPWDADAVVEFRKLVQKGLSSSEVEKTLGRDFGWWAETCGLQESPNPATVPPCHHVVDRPRPPFSGSPSCGSRLCQTVRETTTMVTGIELCALSNVTNVPAAPRAA
eukprot:g12617.t1